IALCTRNLPVPFLRESVLRIDEIVHFVNRQAARMVCQYLQEHIVQDATLSNLLHLRPPALSLRGNEWRGRCLASRLKPIPRFEHKPAGAILAVLSLLVAFQDAKRFGRVVVTHYASGVENVAQLLACKAVQACEVC